MHETKRPLKVFLCHASIDKPKVRELYRYLRRRGVNPWFDEEHLVGGQDWQVEIPKALATSDAIIICLTKNSVDKEGYIQKEIKFALDKALEMPEGRIFLIPVKFEECEVPFSLSRYQWVDLTIESGYSKMMKALKFRASQLERATVELSKTGIEEDKLAREKTAREKEEREAAEKAVRENVEKDATEKAWLESEEKAKQKAAKIKAEREAAKKAAREEEKRVLAEKVAREKEKPEIQKPQGNSSVIFEIVGIIFAIVLVIWLSSNNGTSPTPAPTSTRTPLPQVSSSSTPIKTSMPSSVSTKLVSTSTQVPTNTPTLLPTKTLDPSDYIDVKGVPMRLVPAGNFIIGSSQGLWESLKKETVSTSAYYIDKYEVTNAFYKVCVDSGACQPPGESNSVTRSNYYGSSQFDNYPVIYVTLDMAKTYCKWRGAQLPTETQWEKAARGTDERVYSWGNTIDCSYANYNNCTGDTTAVGLYESGKSPYGVYDMAGNVLEWTNTTYYYFWDETWDPSHALRGGDWKSIAFRSTTYYRDKYGKGAYGNAIGFRCVRNGNP